MARLCVRVAPNEHPTDASLTPMRTNLGDVVCIVDDDHKFSYAELNNGHYRIVDVPGIPQEELIHLCDHSEDAQGQMTKRRVRSLDSAVLKSAQWAGKTTATKAQIAAITVTKV